MSKSEIASLASELIEAALPISPSYAGTVRAVVGSKWSYKAGTFDLQPKKIITRRFELNTHMQTSRFSELFVYGSGTSEFRELFNDPNMLTNIWGNITHEGKLFVSQTPRAGVLDIPQITTADVGRMMLANDMLYEESVGDFRPQRLPIAGALLNLCTKQVQ